MSETSPSRICSASGSRTSKIQDSVLGASASDSLLRSRKLFGFLLSSRESGQSGCWNGLRTKPASWSNRNELKTVSILLQLEKQQENPKWPRVTHLRRSIENPPRWSSATESWIWKCRVWVSTKCNFCSQATPNDPRTWTEIASGKDRLYSTPTEVKSSAIPLQ